MDMSNSFVVYCISHIVNLYLTYVILLKAKGMMANIGNFWRMKGLYTQIRANPACIDEIDFYPSLAEFLDK